MLTVALLLIATSGDDPSTQWWINWLKKNVACPQEKYYPEMKITKHQ